jgi:hypothetical protein
MQHHVPASIYQQQIQLHETSLAGLLKTRSRMGWIRLFVFLLTIFISYQVFINFGLWGILAVVTGIGILLFLVSKDTNNNQKIENAKALIRINKDELAYLEHDYINQDDGSQFEPASHDYANDLDLFGKSSVFQYLNRCHSDPGQSFLAQNLLQPISTEKILNRHEAVKELSNKVEWRQQLQAYSILNPVKEVTSAKASQWISEEDAYFKGKGWKFFVNIYSLITLGTLVATILGFIPGAVFGFLFVLFFAFAIILSRNTIKPYIQLGGIVKEISTLQQMVEWIENPQWNSTYLKQLRSRSAREGEPAHREIKILRSILDKFDLRLSIVGLLFFNSFLLWDIRQMMALNEWRNKNRFFLKHWFELIAEMEVLNSLAALHFNHPAWSFPLVQMEHFILDGKQIGHPLIAEGKRVDNDFAISGIAKTGLITGSNMAGKSTFLRSLGVNLVMAQMGAVVCARSFTFSPVRLMSSMRIADNLAENTSTFYAELKKLKTIIEAVNRKEKVFILLDEILRGTNSYDRHIGSAALIAQLIRENAVAVIATHDVELASLKDKFRNNIENYHFDVQVEGEELYFDYKLKTGICQSLNASILMKKIGIRLDET